MKKRLLYTLIFLFLCSLFLAVYSFPKTINLNYPAIQYRTGDPASVEQINLHIKGTLYRPLFKNPSFHGRISFDQYDYPSYKMFDIIFYRDILSGWGRILYVDGSKPAGFTFGSIWKKGAFDQVKIDVNEPVGPEAGESRHTNLQITAPANDYDTAVKIYEGFSK